MRALSQTIKLTRVNVQAASAGTAINATGVDMAGFHGVMFFGTMTTANAANFANAAGGATLAGSYADIAGTKVVPGDNGDQWLIDLVRPLTRFVRCEIDRGGADTIVGDIWALQYGSRASNPGHETKVDAETHYDPVAGTA